MELRDLVLALVCHDTLTARQWIADATRAGVSGTAVPIPVNLGSTEMAVAAGMVETLAARAQVAPPTWTREVPPLAEPSLLVRAAASMPRLRRLCETEGPEPLRRRRLLAPPEFMTAA